MFDQVHSGTRLRRRARPTALGGASLIIAIAGAATLAQAGEAPLVTFSVGSHWEGGYGGGITIENRGDAAMDSWALEYAGGPQIGSLWNGVLTDLLDGRRRVSNTSWNGALAAGASVSIGFNGLGTMTDDVTDATLNGESAEVAYDLPAGWGSGEGSGGEAGGGDDDGGGGDDGNAGLEPPVVRFRVTSHWNGGYGATISIENVGSATIESWQLEFSGGPEIVDLWNGSHSIAGATSTVNGPAWNPDIAAGGAVSVGFTGLGTLGETVSNCRVNGIDATVLYELPDGWGSGGESGGGESGGGETGGGE